MRFKSSKKLCIVYGLYDSDDRLRYIGQTRSSIERRKKWFYIGIKQLLRMGKLLSPIDKWIHAGNPFTIKEIDDAATWDVSEIIYIDRYRQAGAQLLNVLRGGTDSNIDVARAGELSQPALLTGDVVALKFDGQYLSSQFRSCLSKHDAWLKLSENEQEDIIWDLVSVVEKIS